jgi:hypothetical protein
MVICTRRDTLRQASADGIHGGSRAALRVVALRRVGAGNLAGNAADVAEMPRQRSAVCNPSETWSVDGRELDGAASQAKDASPPRGFDIPEVVFGQLSTIAHSTDGLFA